MQELTLAGWRKSSRSGQQTDCVEIGSALGAVGIRDTKNREGGTLIVSRDVFTRFLTSVKADRLN